MAKCVCKSFKGRIILGGRKDYHHEEKLESYLY